MIKITFTDSSTVVVKRVVFYLVYGRPVIGVIYNDGDEPIVQCVEEVESIEAAWHSLNCWYTVSTMKNEDVVRICRNIITGQYYLVRGECKDLFDEYDYVVIRKDNKDEYVRKHLFDSFENVSYRMFKKLNKEAGF